MVTRHEQGMRETPDFELVDARTLDENRTQANESARNNPNRESSVRAQESIQSIDTHLDANDILDVMLRRKWFILAIILISLTFTAVALQRVTPVYTATAQVIIDVRQAQIPTVGAVLPGLASDNESVRSEVEVLKSRTLAAEVVSSLELAQDAEFNPRLRPPGTVDQVLEWLGLTSAPATTSNSVPELVDSLLDHTDVSPVPNSRVISISATSEIPEKAAMIANTLVDEYVRSQQEGKFRATIQASEFLGTRIGELQVQLASTEREIEQFRSDSNLLETDGITITAQQMSDLNSQLISARTATAEAAARLQQLTLLADSPESGGIFTASEVLQSALIQNLREQQVTVERRLAELSSELGPAHPTMVQLLAEANDVRAQIQVEVEKIAQGLRNEMAIAQTRERALERQLNDLSSTVSETNIDEIHLRNLEREAAVTSELLASLLARQKEVDAQDQIELQRADASVISYADPPSAPSYPQKAFIFGIVTFLSALIALVIVFVRELRRHGFEDCEKLEMTTGIPAIGFIPWSRKPGRRDALADAVVTATHSPYTQALSTLNWQLTNMAPERAKSILITSSTGSEGKSATTSGLARLKALSGKKTLLIDADLRRPVIHQLLNTTKEPGLTDVLLGKVTLRDALTFDPKSSLDVLACGTQVSDPLALIDGPRMSLLLNKLGEVYEYIIIDSPPVLVAPDASVISSKADTTLFVVRYAQTPADIVRDALRQLDRSGGHITGTLLTMVETRRHSRYARGYYSYYGYGDTAQDRGPAESVAS